MLKVECTNIKEFLYGGLKKIVGGWYSKAIVKTYKYVN